MRTWTALPLLLLATALPASAGEDDGPPKGQFLIGVAGDFLVSRSPGLGVSGVATLELGRFTGSVELMLAEQFKGWDVIMPSLQAGAFLRAEGDTPYLQVGVASSTIADFFNEKRGRSDLLLTGEAGYVFRSAQVRHQLWFGIRGLAPVSTSGLGRTVPDLPVALLIVRYVL